MSELKAKKRDISSKGKQLRREGIIPGILYGKHMDKSLSIQIDLKDAVHFLNSNSAGSRLELVVGRKKYMALLKEVTYVPVTNAIEHFSFQALTAGEKVTSTAHIVLHHKDKVDGVVQLSLDEISYKALPKDLIERIDIDLEGMKVGTTILVSDLEIVKNEALEILTHLDDVVLTISEHKEYVEETPEGEEGEAAEVDAAEVPLVDDEKSDADKEEK